MNRTVKIALGASALVIALSLAACAAPADEAAPEPTVDVSAENSTAAPTTSSAPESPSPAATHAEDSRDTEYRAQVASWADPVPPGFAWPASITGTPAGTWRHGGDWDGYTTAAGVYHCMLVYAAWNAYFRDNDPVASKEYAARADATMPDVPYPNSLTRDDGTVDDQDLASESGICNGFVGQLVTP